MSAEEFEKIFGNIPFEDIKKIQEYIDENYISKQEIKEFIEKNQWDLLETEYHFDSTVVDVEDLNKLLEK